MTAIALRPASKTDEKAIKALIKTVGINPLGLKWQQFVIAVDDAGELIGCGQVKSHGDGSRELASIAVKKGWRQQGVARCIIEQLQTDYGRPLWLTCLSHLVPFYEQYAFVEITARSQMPPYFRRVKRFFKLYTWLARNNLRLAVMVWKAEQEKGW